jgi:hypothetical protein
MNIETSLGPDEILERSAKIIENFNQKDDAYPDLSELVSSSRQSGSTLRDYKSVPLFFRRDSTPMVLPQALQDYLGCK